MKLALVNAPLTDPSCPPLGLSYLAATLSRLQIDYRVFDLNLDFWQSIVASKAGVSFKGNGDFELRGGETPAERYGAVAAAVAKQLAQVEAISPGYRLGLGTAEYPWPWGDVAAATVASKDCTQLFTSWAARSNVLSDIVDFEPDIVGVSLTFEQQLLPTLAVLRNLRSRVACEIVLGGGLMNTFARTIGPATPFWDLVDDVVLGPGELFLQQLVCADHRSNGRQRDGHRVRDFRNVLLDPPEPTFTTFPLSEYWSPGVVLPFRINSRCGYGRCAFCADARYSYHQPVCSGSPEDVACQLGRLVAQHGARGVSFLDAQLQHRFLRQLSAAILSTGVSYTWGGNARFESSLANREDATLLASAGCRLLRFGLESGSSRSLALMQKGISLDVAHRVLRSVHEAGIVTHVYLLTGFPGEDVSSWDESMDFLWANIDYIDMFNVSSFQLYEDAPIWRQLRSLGEVRDSSGPAMWLYPEPATPTADIPREPEKLIMDFLQQRGGTRSCLTTAHTLCLAETLGAGLFTSDRPRSMDLQRRPAT